MPYGNESESSSYLNSATFTIASPYYGTNDSTSTPVSWSVTKPVNDRGIHPILYFKYIKSRFNILQQHQLDKRLKALEEAFNTAVENGQQVLAEKFLLQLDVEARESAAVVKGLKYWIKREDLMKHKNNIQGGHISNTLFKDYTRVIPKKVIKEKDKFNGIFDVLEIWHYYNAEQKDLKTLSREEKEKMKDPVLFGMIKGSDKMYFIADWEDEYCDLTFSEIVKALGNKKYKLGGKPNLDVTK